MFIFFIVEVVSVVKLHNVILAAAMAAPLDFLIYY